MKPVRILKIYFLVALDEPREAIKEGLSQQCIYEELSSTNNLELFANYLRDLSHICPGRARFYECSQNIAKNQKLMNMDNLQKCVEYGLKDGSLYLDQWLQASTFHDYTDVPSAFINHNLVRGIMKGDMVASAVCDSIHKSSKPQECDYLSQFLGEEIQSALKFIEEEDKKSAWINLFWAFIVLQISVCMFWGMYLLFKRLSVNTISQDMGDKVDAFLAEYHRVRDQDTSATQVDSETTVEIQDIDRH